MWAFIFSPQFSVKTHPSILERVMGIEPTSSAWKAEVLPLNYTRLVQTHHPYIRSGASNSFRRMPQSLTSQLPGPVCQACKNPDSLCL
jgi:hypothetical protein